MTALVTPVPKKASDSMGDYIAYFQRLSIANDWDDKKQAAVFPSMMEVGNKCLDGFADTTLASFSAIKKALLGESEPFRESNMSELWNIQRNENEKLQQYRERIAGLVEKVYPKFAAANKQCLIRDVFVHSLPNDYQKYLYTSNSSKIEEALNSALLYESMKKATANTYSNSTKPRYPKNSDKTAFNNGAGKSPVTQTQSTTGETCHFCHKTGHFARDCFKKQQYNKKKEARNTEKKEFGSMTAKYSVALQVDDGVEELMVDTGAEVSVLPASRYRGSGASITLYMADGTAMRTKGQLSVKLKTLDGRELMEHPFEIADVKKCYVGSDIMEKLGAVVDYGKHEFIINENVRIPLSKNCSNDKEKFIVLSDIDYGDDVEFLTNDVPEINDNSFAVGNLCNDDEKNKLLQKLNSYDDLFHGIGKTHLVQHFIPTVDNVPINLPSYRLPVHLKNKATKVIDNYEENGILKPSDSEYCSPVILIKKPDSDDVRVTIDYRALNAKSKKDPFTSPRIDDLIDKLHGADCFSKIDVRAAYHNIEVAPEDRHKTAFRFNGKLYEWTRTPFGLSSAPGTYNRLMSIILNKMDDFTAGYFDDVIVFSKGKENHWKHLDEVLSSLYESGLKLNKEKCKFFVDNVEFLGYNISENSVTLANKKIDAIKNYPVPKTVKAVKRFLGLTGFYRKLVENYSKIASPLNEMMRKGSVFNWTSECKNSFDTLINVLCSSPVLRISNPDWPYIVKVDSSKFGVGCILEQEDPVTKQRYVIEYASSKYNDTQQRYPAIELEVCGLIFAVKHWNCYLIGKPFVVETDSKVVQWIKQKRDHVGKLGRWALFLENYDFQTVHVPGKNHQGPDALSRVHEFELNEFSMNNRFLNNLNDLNFVDCHDEIESDPKLKILIDKRDISIVENVYVKSDNKCIVVPKSKRQEILRLLHDNYGHVGINKMLHRVRERYFWPQDNKDIQEFCKACHSCAVNKDNRAPNNAPLLPIDHSVLEPFQRVGMDILGPLPEAEDGSKYLLVMQDYFTKWPEMIALKSVDTDAVLNWLTFDIIPRHGVFSELITDQGVQFISEKFKSFCRSVGIKHKTTSPFHPQTDGMVEKFNRTFLNMIRNYVTTDQKDWPTHIPLILYSYRTAVNDTTKVSPAEALQGRKFKLPIDMMRPPSLTFDSDSSSSLDELFEKMKVIRSNVRKEHEKSLVKRQQCYDKAKNRDIREEYKIGDLVYWKKPVAKKGRSPKLSPIWQGPFTIKNKLSLYNYVLTDEDNSVVTVHINNLKLCKDSLAEPVKIGTRGRPRVKK